MNQPRKDERFPADPNLTSLIQHWATLRIDTPVQVVARLDDVAKQVIVVAGILQGILIAVLKIEKPPPQLPVFTILATGVLVVTVACAATVIYIQSDKFVARPTYELLKNFATHGVNLDKLDCEFISWCEDIDRVRIRKHRWLVLAMVALVLSLASSAVCLAIAVL